MYFSPVFLCSLLPAPARQREFVLQQGAAAALERQAAHFRHTWWHFSVVGTFSAFGSESNGSE
jgi:hypothetical protein